MSVIDIFLAVPLIWASWKGSRSGVFIQVAGLAALFAGVWIAWKFGSSVGMYFGDNPQLAATAGFIIVFIIVVIAFAVAGRLLRGLFRFAGLGTLDRIGGVILSLAKVGIILAVLCYGFDRINRETSWVGKDKLGKSFLYEPLVETADILFPYIDVVKNKLFDSFPDEHSGHEPQTI